MIRLAESMRRDHAPDRPHLRGSGLPMPSNRGTLHIPDERVDALEGPAVLSLPVQVVGPGVIGPAEQHHAPASTRSWAIVWPCRTCAMPRITLSLRYGFW